MSNCTTMPSTAFIHYPYPPHPELYHIFNVACGVFCSNRTHGSCCAIALRHPRTVSKTVCKTLLQVTFGILLKLNNTEMSG